MCITLVFSGRSLIQKLLLALVALISIAGPMFAYDIALKDGRVIHFKKYHVAEGKLYFTDYQGREDSVVLDSINLDRTWQLNLNENPALDLPGLARNLENEASPQQVSLGDAARQARGNKSVTTQRVFTNDDVNAATAEDRIHDWIKAGAKSSSSDTEQSRKIGESAMLLARTGQRMTEQEVASMALGKLDEIRFPGRDRWQAQLYAAHQKVYALLETCVERTEEENQTACSKIEYARMQLESLQQEGIKRASSWKTDREK
jgi:hypothetical protein